ncbi:MAG: flagellar export protein FliJ [bacterium]
MSNFNFRLQKVLDLKQRHAQAAATRLVVAQHRADDARDAADALASIRHAGSAQLAAAHSGTSTAGQLQNISFLLERLDERRDQAALLAFTAQESVADAQGELTLAHQARRALDRLRERQFGDWQQTLNRNDSQTMDALALTRFARRASSPDQP